MDPPTQSRMPHVTIASRHTRPQQCACFLWFNSTPVSLASRRGRPKASRRGRPLTFFSYLSPHVAVGPRHHVAAAHSPFFHLSRLTSRSPTWSPTSPASRRGRPLHLAITQAHASRQTVFSSSTHPRCQPNLSSSTYPRPQPTHFFLNPPISSSTHPRIHLSSQERCCPQVLMDWRRVEFFGISLMDQQVFSISLTTSPSWTNTSSRHPPYHLHASALSTYTTSSMSPPPLI